MCIISQKALAQPVWENHRTEVYNYLYRMAQKGLLNFDDNVRPLGRKYLRECLDTLTLKSAVLSKTENSELRFYLKEYTDGNENSNSRPVRFLKSDSSERWRFLEIGSRNFSLRMDPVFTAATLGGTNRKVKQYSSGFTAYGYAGSHWSYYFSYNDVNETGMGIDTSKSFTPETGIVTRVASNKKSHNYAELRGGISYGFSNGSVSIGHDQLLWGYGDNGRIVLSDKAPSYPFIRFDYKPLKWLSLFYMHAWLNSNIIDSSRSIPTGNTAYGGRQEFYVPKYLSIHSVNVTPVKGLDFTFGESIVYNDPSLVGYLIPVMFFKVYDNLVNNNNINASSNGQLFLQVSSRNHVPKTHIYGTLFIDEIRISSVFDPVKSRNQLGATLGLSRTDLIIPYLTVGLEYTRINPFVYRNLLPAQNYISSSYPLGDWMGNNADRFLVSVRYTPVPRVKMLMRYQLTRKGGDGSIDQQYFQQPQPGFLFDPQSRQKSLEFRTSFEWINRLNLYGAFQSQQTKSYGSGMSSTRKLISLGINYGL